MFQHEGIHILHRVFAVNAIDVPVTGNHVPLVEFAPIGLGQIVHGLVGLRLFRLGNRRRRKAVGRLERGVDLGLYSMTFNNDLERDLLTLETYKQFRVEAEQKGFRHFLEVFDPNAPGTPPADLPRFIGDHIARALAGRRSLDADRPI